MNMEIMCDFVPQVFEVFFFFSGFLGPTATVSTSNARSGDMCATQMFMLSLSLTPTLPEPVHGSHQALLSLS